MSKARLNERVFIRGARLSFPALAEARPVMDGSEDKKFQASFIIPKNAESVKAIKDATVRIANAQWGDKAKMVLANTAKLPLRDGDTKDCDGYAGNYFINAKSKFQPELRDADGRRVITDAQEIREKFVGGYKVNAYIELYPYEFSGMKGISAALVAVQFAGYGEAFGGGKPRLADDAFPAEHVEVSTASVEGFEEDVPF